ncbi:RsiV family protein [Peribacillus alkalitolerans]|uniref:RsiV family protein n=1 Tax=Peribacillus alkalitolerans TaxID=1550385 RepID=UPI0013D85745|nr:RsiV family protein [Peribacillus alkalitolerans]
MDKKLEELKMEYKNVPIPGELDDVIKNAFKRPSKKGYLYKWITGTLVTAASAFILLLNTSPSFAKTLSDVPVLKDIVSVVTFTEFKVEEENYKANIKVPKVTNLEDKSLEKSLNEKYMNENKQLYEEFKAEVDTLKKEKGGHLGVESGYVVQTDTENLLTIGRYVVNTVGSSSTTFKYDTIDKKKEILLTLPILFKNDQYIHVISENIKNQMREQIKADPAKVYWVTDAGIEDPIDPFQSITSEQNFYINKEGKLVISFNKYEVAPGYMGVVEFIIPTQIITDSLVGDEYIK